jgi:hypothetical protein
MEKGVKSINQIEMFAAGWFLPPPVSSAAPAFIIFILLAAAGPYPPSPLPRGLRRLGTRRAPFSSRESGSSRGLSFFESYMLTSSGCEYIIN